MGYLLGNRETKKKNIKINKNVTENLIRVSGFSDNYNYYCTSGVDVCSTLNVVILRIVSDSPNMTKEARCVHSTCSYM